VLLTVVNSWELLTMRRFVTAGVVLAVAISVSPMAARGAGDASASRRATRTTDTRYFTNSRPGVAQTSSRYRVSGVQTVRPTANAGCRGR